MLILSYIEPKAQPVASTELLDVNTTATGGESEYSYANTAKLDSEYAYVDFDQNTREVLNTSQNTSGHVQDLGLESAAEGIEVLFID